LGRSAAKRKCKSYIVLRKMTYYFKCKIRLNTLCLSGPGFQITHNLPLKMCIRNVILKSRDVKGKGKAIPVQAWTGPEGSRMLRLPDFKTVVI